MKFDAIVAIAQDLIQVGLTHIYRSNQHFHVNHPITVNYLHPIHNPI